MFKCKKCDVDARSLIDGICQQCQIEDYVGGCITLGNKNPAHWVLQKVKDDIMEERKPGISKIRTGYKGVKYHINGQYMNDIYYPQDVEKKMVSISCSAQCDNNKIWSVHEKGFPNLQVSFHRWTNNGMTAFRKAGPFKISNIETFVEETLPHFHESLMELINFAKTNQFFCSGCDKTFQKDKVAGFRFAANFCHPCWEKYKKENSRSCFKCKRPLYECYC